MSIKDELSSLKQQRETLQKEMENVSSELRNLYSKKETISQKVAMLQGRKSSLAQTLLENAQKELEAVCEAITLEEKKQAELASALEEKVGNISKREDETTLYIQEQSVKIVSCFLEYMEKHLEDIGSEFQKTYHIMEVTSFEDDRYGGCNAPTGLFGIYDEKAKSFIVTSGDFYFKNTLCTFSRGTYDELICIETEWHKEYCKQFVSIFLETLKKNYTYEEVFTLTIEDSSFTLDLV